MGSLDYVGSYSSILDLCSVGIAPQEVPEDLLTVCGQLNFSASRDWMLFNGSSAINFPSTAVLKSS
jgi:hypothetical protein